MLQGNSKHRASTSPYPQVSRLGVVFFFLLHQHLALHSDPLFCENRIMAPASSSAVVAPRRSITLFEKTGASVRRLARRLSLSSLGPKESQRERSSSVATVRSGVSEVSPPPERPKSRLARWRSSKYSVPAAVMEEAGEDQLIRSATPRGFEGAQRNEDEERRVVLQVPWQLPKARVFRQVRGGGQPEYDVAPLVRGQRVRVYINASPCRYFFVRVLIHDLILCTDKRALVPDWRHSDLPLLQGGVPPLRAII
jgi:hypothetical protein